MCPSSPLQLTQDFISTPSSNGRYCHHHHQSLAIPMPESHVHRTDSEVRLSLETIEAKYRDQLMLDRLVRGGCCCQQNHWGVRQASCGDPDFVSRDEENNLDEDVPNDHHAMMPMSPRELLQTGAHCWHHSENEVMANAPQLRRRRRRSSKEMGLWAIEGFDEEEDEDEDGGIEVVPMPDMYNRQFNLTEKKTTFVPCMHDCNDEFCHHDDEVFDLDL